MQKAIPKCLMSMDVFHNHDTSGGHYPWQPFRHLWQPFRNLWQPFRNVCDNLDLTLAFKSKRSISNTTMIITVNTLFYMARSSLSTGQNDIAYIKSGEACSVTVFYSCPTSISAISGLLIHVIMWLGEWVVMWPRDALPLVGHRVQVCVQQQ